MPPTEPSPKTLISVRQARARLSIGHSKAYELINAGEVQSLLLGGKRLIVAQSIDALIERKLAESLGARVT